jgi:hypothetical protein
MTRITIAEAEAASAIRNSMAIIRRDVALGLGANIEPDAVVLSIAYGFMTHFAADTAFDRKAFLTACDLDDLIPSEAFQRA